MKIIIHNREQLKKIFQYIEENIKKAMYLDFDFFVKDKTKKQLGYVFDCLFGSVQTHFHEQGNIYTITDIKEDFYEIMKAYDDRFNIRYTNILGESKERPLRLSEMDIDQMSLFISNALMLIDNHRMFEGIRLHPSVRYSWIYKINDDDLRTINRNIPDRDPEYLSYVRKESCSCCGIANRSEAHHLRAFNLGGMAIKPSDVYTLPLCESCHRELAHGQGNPELLKSYTWITDKMSITDFLEIKYNRWKFKK